MAETNVILKYKRSNDSWLCPECDAENQLTRDSCSVCGRKTMGRVTIVKAWSEADERPADIPATHHMPPPISDTYRSAPGTIPVESESHYGKVFLWTIAIVAVVIFVCYMIKMLLIEG